MNREVRTERLLLRSLTDEDAAAFIRIHRVSEAHFRPWSPEPSETPEEHELRYLK
jgi:RimJ/RimL family protein N-acetyltransferase